jgi:subtilisin family serine protease
MNKWFIRTILILLVYISLSIGFTFLVQAQNGSNQISLDGADNTISSIENRYVFDPGSTQIFIIRLKDKPLASYRGEIPGLQATNPFARGETKLNAKSLASQTYRDYLLGKQEDFIARAESLLARKIDIKYQYYAATNGMAVYLTVEEAEKIRGMLEVEFIQPNFYRQLDTDAGPTWIGAPGIWDGSNTGGIPGTKGEGIIIGIIDTGINPSNPSFADIGGDSYNHTNPWGSGNYVGVCDPANSLYDASFPCNDKVIGAWGYSTVNSGNPRDYNGHGSHTASTAAGNFTNAQVVGHTITMSRQISGVAPHANIVAYAACCDGDTLVAAIDQTVIDGVDVVNYSIGSTSPSHPWTESDTLAFLSARDAGIFVSGSAGNQGPSSATVGGPNDSPWIMANAATSHNRIVANLLMNLSGGSTTPPGEIRGLSFTSGYGPAKIVYAGNYGDALCLNPFSSGTFQGAIVICDRGQNARVDKGSNVQAGGAGGMVLANAFEDGNQLVSDDHYLPAVHITYDDGVLLKAWVGDGGGDHFGTIRGTQFELDDNLGDYFADFSSRGPNRAVQDIIKPNISAPGLSILAAVGIGDPSPPQWTFYDGTSMASPHGAGSAALIKALHPTWTPDEIQSALMMTAWEDLLDYDGTAPDPFDEGSGRIDLSLAGKAGLVMNETRANYEAANPATGGNPSTLNLASLGKGACYQTCSWTRSFRNTQNTSVMWTVIASSTNGMDLTVSPGSFTIPAGGIQTITVNADVRRATPNVWIFGEIKLTPNNSSIPSAHLPVAAFPNSSTGSDVFDKTANIDLVQLDNTLFYTVTLTHKSLTAKSYNINDPIPANASYVAGSATGGLTYNSGTNTLTWSGDIPAGDFVISEENKTGYISFGDLGVTPVDLPIPKDTGCWGVNLNNLVYFGQTYTKGIWSANGTLEASLSGSGSCSGNTNGQVPSTSSPNNLLAPWWDDLNFTSGGSWYFVGVTWNGKSHSVLSWENVPVKGTSETASFQIWFEDGVDNIWFTYKQNGMPTGSPTATVGAENSAGNDGATYYYYSGSGSPTGKVPTGTVDLVLGPLPIVMNFTFQVTATNTPGITNQATMTQGSTTQTTYKYNDVYLLNTWLGNTSNWQTSSNWSRNVLPATFDWVVIPTHPSGGNMPVLNGNVAIFKLEIQTGASLDLATYNLTVENSIINNGTLRQTYNVPSGLPTRFFDLSNASKAQSKYFGIDITPSGSMGNTTVEVRGNSQCTTTDPSDTINRCYEITPTTSQTSTIRFYYLSTELDGQDPATLKVWHWNPASGWQAAGSVLSRNSLYVDKYWVEVNGVNTYSPFTLSEKISGPTNVSIETLYANSRNKMVLPIILIGIIGVMILFSLAVNRPRNQVR